MKLKETRVLYRQSVVVDLQSSKESQEVLREESRKKVFEKIGRDLRVGNYHLSVSEEVSETDHEEVVVYTVVVRISE